MRDSNPPSSVVKGCRLREARPVSVEGVLGGEIVVGQMVDRCGCPVDPPHLD